MKAEERSYPSLPSGDSVLSVVSRAYSASLESWRRPSRSIQHAAPFQVILFRLANVHFVSRTVFKSLNLRTDLQETSVVPAETDIFRCSILRNCLTHPTSSL